MIYRLYVLWDRNPWICIFPTLCWLGGIVSGILVIMAFSQQTSTVQALINAELAQRKLVTIAYCVTLALNVLCTGMISMRIWNISRQVQHVLQSPLNFSRPIRTIVDSATIYTAFSLATLVVYLVHGRSAAFTLMSCTGPVIGLSFCLIIVRVGLSRVHDQDSAARPFRSSSDHHYLPSASPNPHSTHDRY
jgi:hypothetical protein